MRQLTCLLTACLLALSSNISFAGFNPASNHIAIAYSMANPDYKPLDDGEGQTLSASWRLGEHLYSYGYYSNVEFIPGGPVHGASQLSHWGALGLGLQQAVTARTILSVSLTQQRIELDGERIHGDGIHLGLSQQLGNYSSITLQVGYIDVDFSDWQYIIEFNQQLTPAAFATARMRDYADWDFSAFELGLGWKF